tara:strand:+ start:437 stop:841 length:405 start_codon:yes stop_codon:yes gene_type:complete
MKILKRGGTNGKKPSDKVRIFLKGLSALSSKGTPQFAEPDKKDYGKKKKGAKSVRQRRKDEPSILGTGRILKKGGMASLDAAQKQVYKRGLAAYMSSGNRPKVSQHAWAMARVKSDFGKKEAAKIRAGKGKKKK